MGPHIELKDLSKIYYSSLTDTILAIGRNIVGVVQEASPRIGSNVAVDHVSLTIQAGERLGIVGRNGAGKSTLLHMIAGLTEPSSGIIKVNGNVTSIFSLGVGLKEDLSGRETIYITGEVQGKSRREIDQVVGEVIEFAELGKFIDYPVRTYSTGMKARLAFSLIIHVEPEILIIDEALSAGDRAFSIKASQKVRELCRKGRIVIIVSHSMHTVIEMCNRCLWMDEGRVVMDGDPTEVTTAYLESVRTKDEAILSEKFRRHMGAESFRTGCHVTQLVASPLSSSNAQSILKAGEDAAFRVGLQVDSPLHAPDLRLRITRLDGLVMAENLLSESHKATPDPFSGSLTFSVAMRPLVLGPGVYNVTVELLDRNEVVAMRSTVLEVVALNVPTGGRTALLYPCEVNVQPIG